MFSRVLCAVNRGEGAARLVRHATAFAAAAGARLSLLHVSHEPPSSRHEDEWHQLFLDAVPYTATYVGQPAVHVVSGPLADTILAQAEHLRADLIVCGTRRRGPMAEWLLGSTSRALLEATTRPILLLPSSDIDMVTIGDTRVELNLGAVLAAIDLAEQNALQLQLAGAMAVLAQRPLILMTVRPPHDTASDHQAADKLRARARTLTGVKAHSVIVRRGEVAGEIVRCAAREDAGLVVMGLRAGARGQSAGEIASAVLRHQRPAVLAVPDATTTVI